LSVSFANPIALLLLLAVVPTVLWARRSIAGLGRLRGGIALALRLAILLLLALALAQAQWSITKDDMAVVYVLDQSRSIPGGDQKDALAYVMTSQKSRKSVDKVGLVLFGRSAALERRPSPSPLLESRETRTAPGAEKEQEAARLQSMISTSRTNIAGALRLALAAMPPASRKRIVLVSDGNENLGSAAEEADVARRHGVRVDVKPVQYEYANEVMVEKVISPSKAEKGESFDVRVVLNAHRPLAAKLRLYENGQLIGARSMDVKEGRNVFVVPRKLSEPGHYSYEAAVTSQDDTLYANNRASSFTVVRGHGRVLYVEGDREHAGALYRALRAQGWTVNLVGSEALPLSVGQVVPYDLVILSNVHAASVSTAGMRALELAVKNWGVGLVMIGGENSFGPGGYQDSPVERALPVSMNIRQRRIMPSGALVVVLHTCEIPQGNYWAQQIALAALRTLSASDEYGVLYYSWQGGGNRGVRWLFKLQRVKNKRMMSRLINSVSPGDMPSFIPAMQSAHKGLKASTASVKHMVMISDGDPQYPNDNTLKAMVGDGITISTIGINPHSQTDTNRLAHVASLGRGRYWQPQTSGELPQIFTKEAATVRRSMIFEEEFRPKVALLSEVVKGMGAGIYPPLAGYVATTPKKLAEVPLVTQHQDPLLAHWQYGLGRTVAFTSDAKARWAARWVDWPKYAQFWGQVVRWVSRSVEDAKLRVRSEVVEDRGHLVVDAMDEEGRFTNGLRFDSVLITPDNKEKSVRVEQTGPGRYEADFEVADVGAHYISLRYATPEGRSAVYTQGLIVPYSSEFRELRANEDLLKSIAGATGGRVLDRGDDVFARTFEAAPAFGHVWPWLLLAAILLVPADVFARRVFLDYAAIWTRVLAALYWVPFLGRRARHAAGRRTEYASALLGRKRASREKIARRARKFEPREGVVPEEPALRIEPTAEKPEVEIAETPEQAGEKPAVERSDESYTGRLLEAKKKLRKNLDESDETDST